MTGLESVQDHPAVLRYLEEKHLLPQNLMPGWLGWDSPHLMHTRTGAIIPTSPERLLRQATAAAFWRHRKNPRLPSGLIVCKEREPLTVPDSDCEPMDFVRRLAFRLELKPVTVKP